MDNGVFVAISLCLWANDVEQKGLSSAICTLERAHSPSWARNGARRSCIWAEATASSSSPSWSRSAPLEWRWTAATWVRRASESAAARASPSRRSGGTRAPSSSSRRRGWTGGWAATRTPGSTRPASTRGRSHLNTFAIKWSTILCQDLKHVEPKLILVCTSMWLNNGNIFKVVNKRRLHLFFEFQ